MNVKLLSTPILKEKLIKGQEMKENYEYARSVRLKRKRLNIIRKKTVFRIRIQDDEK